MESNQYFKLGVVVLKTMKQDWEFLQQNPAIFLREPAENNQELRKYPCQIRSESSVLNTWSTNYKLHVDGFDPITIQYKQLITLLINFTDNQRIIINRPSPLPAPDRQVFFSPHDYLILDNYQNCFCFSLSLQIWVLQGYLIELTNQYEKQKHKNVKNIKNSEGKNILNEREFLRILAETTKIGSLTNNIASCHEVEVGNSINQEDLVRQQISNLMKKSTNLLNLDSTNNVVSFNFNSESCQAGLFFDLDNQRIETQPSPVGFQGSLREYQAKALTWMLYREGKHYETGIDMSHVPYWIDKGSELGLKQKLFLNWDENFVVWNRAVEKKCDGGILADDMGLGKTVMVIALILANRPSDACKTLIIAPLSVIKQWQDQIKKFAPQLKSVLGNQISLSQNKIQEFDVVIVSQGKIRAEANRDRGKAAILQYDWFRVVVDEAHNFKNYKTQMAKTIYTLKSDYRWCLTGTPTQNSLGDLFSLVKFLKFHPWCFESYWESKFPTDPKKTRSEHFLKLKLLLRGILLRRKKHSLDEKGLALVNLPRVDIKVHLVQMSEQAKALYKIIDWKAQNTLKSLQNIEESLKRIKEKARRVLLNEKKKLNLNRILSLLTKMRMISCHEYLAGYSSDFIFCHKFIEEYLKHLGRNKVLRVPRYNFFQYSLATSEERQVLGKFTANLNIVYQNWDQKVRDISLGIQSECLICHQLDESVVTPCLHAFCKKCIEQFIESKWTTQNLDEQYFQTKLECKQNLRKKTMKDFETICPYCEQKLKMRELFPLPKINEFNRPLSNFLPNQKILALMKYLQKMNYTDKALIFTSFLGMMTLICLALDAKKITYLTIKGTDTHEIRYQRISEFNSNTRIQVLILTLKTGSVGLNMEAANKVFFMDPWWNPAIEEQAIGRVHRLGQEKEVEAVKFITQSSIEARILKLSLIKKQMSDSVLDIDDITNDKRYSKTRSQIKFLLSVQESCEEEENSNQRSNE